MDFFFKTCTNTFGQIISITFYMESGEGTRQDYCLYIGANLRFGGWSLMVIESQAGTASSSTCLAYPYNRGGSVFPTPSTLTYCIQIYPEKFPLLFKVPDVDIGFDNFRSFMA